MARGKRRAQEPKEREAREKPLSGKLLSLYEVVVNARGKTLGKRETMNRLGYQQQPHSNRDLKDARLTHKLKERGIEVLVGRSAIFVEA